MSNSLEFRRALCQTGCIIDGQMTRDRFNNDFLDEWPSSNKKYLSDLIFSMLLRSKTNNNQSLIRSLALGINSFYFAWFIDGFQDLYWVLSVLGPVSRNSQNFSGAFRVL